MNIDTLIEPTVEPVTLADVYLHLRLTPDVGSPISHPDDAMLRTHITAARKDCEQRTHRAFVKQKLRMTLHPRSRFWPWPLGRPWCTPPIYERGGCGAASVELLRPPFLSIASVSYYDGANVLQVVDPSKYFVTDERNLPARLQFLSGFSLEGGIYDRRDALRIDYWAGYQPLGSPEDDFTTSVPQTIKAAVLMGVEMLYDAMTPQERAALFLAQSSLLSPYLVHALA
jgi:hypothetical protein